MLGKSVWYGSLFLVVKKFTFICCHNRSVDCFKEKRLLEIFIFSSSHNMAEIFFDPQLLTPAGEQVVGAEREVSKFLLKGADHCSPPLWTNTLKKKKKSLENYFKPSVLLSTDLEPVSKLLLVKLSWTWRCWLLIILGPSLYFSSYQAFLVLEQKIEQFSVFSYLVVSVTHFGRLIISIYLKVLVK